MGSSVGGIGFDPRIGSDYNNPLFGYGGYCLRKDHVANMILERGPEVVGIYRLTMKKDSDNFSSR